MPGIDIVDKLTAQGWSEGAICRELGFGNAGIAKRRASIGSRRSRQCRSEVRLAIADLLLRSIERTFVSAQQIGHHTGKDERS